MVPVGSYPLVTRQVSGVNGWKVCKFQRAGYYHRNAHHVRGNLEPLRQGEAGRRNVEIRRYLRRPGLQPAGEVGRARSASGSEPRRRGTPPKLSSVRLTGRGPRGFARRPRPPVHRDEPDGGKPIFRGECGGVQRDGDGDAHRRSRHVGPGNRARVPARETVPRRRSARRVQEVQAGQGIERDQFDDVL